tara:strand:+ start:231 stop:1664 length:1434 start_codon:yes stop_codon:yes gene_type:complete
MEFGNLQMYIDGEMKSSVDNLVKDIYSPLNGQKIASLAWGNQKDALVALESASKGFEFWSKLALSKRKEWMSKLREKILENEVLLRKAISYEMGKPYSATAEDIESITNSLKYYADIIDDFVKPNKIAVNDETHNHKLISKPIGVVVAYLAWNFPLLNAGFKIGPALASGCSLILKPSELSPVSLYIIGNILKQINFPKGVINIICGEPTEVAQTLSKSTIPNLITMIGSTETAKKVISDSSTSIKKYSMELGGNAPFVIFDDADIDSAINIGAAIKFGNCGQICVAANRFFVHEKVYDKFLNGLIDKAKNLKIGYSEDLDFEIGPLISKKSRDRINNLIKDTIDSGGNLEYGGGIPKMNGNWFEPTIITGINESMSIFHEEIFGPVASIIKFKNDDEVLNQANKTQYGLASYLFTKNKKRIDKFVDELDFGEIHVNGIKYDIYLPHGGIKQSGVGHDCSELALEDYLIKKRISIAK